MANHALVRHRSRADFVLVLHGFHADFHREFLHFVADVGQWVDEFLHFRINAVVFDEFLHDGAEGTQFRAHVAQYFTTEQVQRLYAVRAFVQLGDARVTHVLFHAVFGDKAVTAEYLHAVVGTLKRVVGQKGFDDRGQQRHVIRSRLTHRFVRMRQFFVDFQGDPVGERTRAFGICTLGQQHATHVRMHEDRIGFFFRIFRTGQRTHLQTFFGVSAGILVGNFGQAKALHTHAQTRCVHHHEHGLQTFVRFTHQPAGRAVEVNHRSGVRVNAHFVFQRTARYWIARAERAVCVWQEFRYDEQGNAFGAFWRFRQASQHEVDDVVRHVVFTAGDEDFGAGDGVGAVGVRNRFGAQNAEVSTAVRFGQTHRAGPFAGHEFWQVRGFQFVRAVCVQAFVRAVAQAWVHGPRQVGGVQCFVQRIVHGDRQSLTAVFRIA